MRPKKIVITAPWGERLGGAENILWSFLRHVDRSRVEPLVVFFEAGPFEREVRSLGLRTITLPAGRLRHLWKAQRVVRDLARLLKREQPDLLLNWAAKTQLYGASAALLAGMTRRTIWWQQGVPHGHWLDRLATFLPAGAVGCYCRAAADAQRKHSPTRSTFVVHPGIEPPRQLPEADLRRLRDSLQIPAGRPLVGIVGRLQPWKGQDLFIRAVAELRRRGHDVHGLVVGGNAWNLSPEYEPRLRRLVGQFGLREAMTFTGQVPDADPYIQLMDVLVNASAEEPFGLVVLEGMAHGVPVVAVDSGGPAEIIEPEQSGVLIPRADSGVLADALDRLLSDERFRHRIGANARQRIADSFTALRMTENLQHRFELLAAPGPA